MSMKRIHTYAQATKQQPIASCSSKSSQTRPAHLVEFPRSANSDYHNPTPAVVQTPRTMRMVNAGNGNPRKRNARTYRNAPRRPPPPPPALIKRPPPVLSVETAVNPFESELDAAAEGTIVLLPCPQPASTTYSTLDHHTAEQDLFASEEEIWERAVQERLMRCKVVAWTLLARRSRGRPLTRRLPLCGDGTRKYVRSGLSRAFEVDVEEV